MFVAKYGKYRMQLTNLCIKLKCDFQFKKD